MKFVISAILLTLFACGLTGGCAIWHEWWYPANYEYALKLADDSSLPQAKANYLREYLKTIDSISGPPRYIFMKPDLKLDKQKEILLGLIERFDEITKLKPSEMAYQQGMFQLTGQEMDNQLKRISGIFENAKIRENPMLYFLFWVLSWVVWLAAIVLWAIVLEDL